LWKDIHTHDAGIEPLRCERKIKIEALKVEAPDNLRHWAQSAVDSACHIGVAKE
jgi:hypothetical protein